MYVGTSAVFDKCYENTSENDVRFRSPGFNALGSQ